MADQTSIEWTDATWNPLRGCTRVKEGCRNCYAEVMAARFSDPGQWGHGFARRVALPGGGIDHRWTGRVELVPEKLDLPLRWKKGRRIFVNSTSDLFHEAVPDEDIDKVFAVMALCPQHTFQVLTKRPARMRAYFHARRDGDPWAEAADYIADLRGMEDHAVVLEPRDIPLPNVWLGVSAEDQETADERIPELLATPADLRFVSLEPLLGPVDLLKCPTHGAAGGSWDWLRGTRNWHSGQDTTPRIDWVIVGSESGPKARPCDIEWVRCIRDQCVSADVPFFWKQHIIAGKKIGLPEIDGKVWKEFPRNVR